MHIQLQAIHSKAQEHHMDYRKNKKVLYPNMIFFLLNLQIVRIFGENHKNNYYTRKK